MAKHTQIKLPRSTFTHLDIYQYTKSKDVCIELCLLNKTGGKLMLDVPANEARAILQKMLDAIEPIQEKNLSLVKCALKSCPHPATLKWHPGKNPESFFWVCKEHVEFLTLVHAYEIIDGEYYTLKEES